MPCFAELSKHCLFQFARYPTHVNTESIPTLADLKTAAAAIQACRHTIQAADELQARVQTLREISDDPATPFADAEKAAKGLIKATEEAATSRILEGRREAALHAATAAGQDLAAVVLIDLDGKARAMQEAAQNAVGDLVECMRAKPRQGDEQAAGTVSVLACHHLNQIAAATVESTELLADIERRIPRTVGVVSRIHLDQAILILGAWDERSSSIAGDIAKMQAAVAAIKIS